MLPILMLLMRTCRNQVGCAALGVTKPSGTADQVFIFCDAVWRRSRMFQADNHDSRCRSVNAHCKRRRCDDDAQPRVATTKMLLDDPPFFPIEVRIVKCDTAREDLAEMARRLRRITGREISQRFVGRWKPKRVSQVLCSVTRLSRCLAENDDLLALLDQLPHERNDPIAMLAFSVNRLDVPRT